MNGTLGSPFLSLIIVKKRNALLYCVGKEQHNSYTELKKKKFMKPPQFEKVHSVLPVLMQI